ncbi:MAG: hypothetical protein R6V84_05300 [Desulfobacterales bacterium]
MKAPTERRKQWIWFVALWCGGLLAALLLARAVRWFIAAGAPSP